MQPRPSNFLVLNKIKGGAPIFESKKIAVFGENEIGLPAMLVVEPEAEHDLVFCITEVAQRATEARNGSHSRARTVNPLKIELLCDNDGRTAIRVALNRHHTIDIVVPVHVLGQFHHELKCLLQYHSVGGRAHRN